MSVLLRVIDLFGGAILSLPIVIILNIIMIVPFGFFCRHISNVMRNGNVIIVLLVIIFIRYSMVARIYQFMSETGLYQF